MTGRKKWESKESGLSGDYDAEIIETGSENSIWLHFVGQHGAKMSLRFKQKKRGSSAGDETCVIYLAESKLYLRSKIEAILFWHWANS